MKKVALLLFLVGCNPYAALIPDTHSTLGPGCWLELPVWEADGTPFVVAKAHYPECPAVAGASKYTWEGFTYNVIWDRHSVN